MARKRKNDPSQKEPDKPRPLTFLSEQIMAKGPRKTVVYAQTASGRMLAKQFLADLVGDAKIMKDKAVIEEHAQILADVGSITNRKRFDFERGNIFAFKAAKLRLAAFQYGDVWFVTHGIKKDEKPWREEEFQRAERIRCEQLTKLGVTP